MDTGLWYTIIPNFGSLSSFLKCKEHPYPVSPDLGLRRMLEIPIWVWYVDLDLDISTGLWYVYNLNCGSPS